MRAAIQSALETDDVVVDLRQGLLIGHPVLLQLGLVGLRLGDGLHQPTLAIQHVQFQRRVAELHQRLARFHAVARLHQDVLDAAALHRIQVDRVMGNDFTGERNDVVIHAPLGGPNREAGGRNADTALCRTEQQHAGNDHQEQRHHTQQQPLPQLQAPPRLRQGPVHAGLWRSARHGGFHSGNHIG